jgi:hypothetical protein
MAAKKRNEVNGSTFNGFSIAKSIYRGHFEAFDSH